MSFFVLETRILSLCQRYISVRGHSQRQDYFRIQEYGQNEVYCGRLILMSDVHLRHDLHQNFEPSQVCSLSSPSSQTICRTYVQYKPKLPARRAIYTCQQPTDHKLTSSSTASNPPQPGTTLQTIRSPCDTGSECDPGEGIMIVDGVFQHILVSTAPILRIILAGCCLCGQDR